MRQALQVALENLPELTSIETYAALQPPSHEVQGSPVLCCFVAAVNELHLLSSCKTYYGPKARVLVFSPSLDSRVITKAIQAGADGFVSMDSSLDDFREAVCQVYSGKRYLAKDLHKAVLEGIFDENIGSSMQLTHKESQILQLICGGLTFMEIAHKLDLTPGTVRRYHSNVMKKFQVHRTTDLIISALKHGFYAAH